MHGWLEVLLYCKTCCKQGSLSTVSTGRVGTPESWVQCTVKSNNRILFLKEDAAFGGDENVSQATLYRSVSISIRRHYCSSCGSSNRLYDPPLERAVEWHPISFTYSMALENVLHARCHRLFNSHRLGETMSNDGQLLRGVESSSTSLMSLTVSLISHHSTPFTHRDTCLPLPSPARVMTHEEHESVRQYLALSKAQVTSGPLRSSML